MNSVSSYLHSFSRSRCTTHSSSFASATRPFYRSISSNNPRWCSDSPADSDHWTHNSVMGNRTPLNWAILQFYVHFLTTLLHVNVLEKVPSIYFAKNVDKLNVNFFVSLEYEIWYSINIHRIL